MTFNLSSTEKFDIQQNFRRYLRLRDRFEADLEQFKTAKASRVWIAGIVALVFAIASDFFLGAAAGMFAVYFFGLVRHRMACSGSEESLESLDRWFQSKGLRFEGRVLYSAEDEMLEQPLDPFNDACYA